MEPRVVTFSAQSDTMPRAAVIQEFPLVYDARAKHLSCTSPGKLFEKFISPDETDEPLDVELTQPDGSTRLRRLPAQLRQLPCEILYDAKGLELFDRITQLDGIYYLTACERDILHNQTEIVSHIPDNASIIELGCGSMTKTSVILDHLQSSGKRGISFYALDIEESFLKASLASLMEKEEKKNVPAEHAIKYAGILGSYDQAIASILKQIKSPRVFLWLGSSIGNCPSRKAAASFLRSFVEVMNSGDLFLVGIDKRNAPSRVALAYNDPYGISSAFGLNGLNHLNELLAAETFPLDRFEYFAGYNVEEGRHEAYYRSLENQVIPIPSTHSDGLCESVSLTKNELIRYEVSYKFSFEEIENLGTSSGMSLKESWTDSENLYALALFKKPITIPRSLAQSGIPSIEDWKWIWAQWDRISSSDVIKDYMEKPIDLRHPMIFYKGHLPAFCDMLLSNCLGEQRTEPQYYETIFDRGIDPDVENPTICHAHSVVPEVWPPLEEIQDYTHRVRKRLVGVYDSIDRKDIAVSPRRLSRVLHMIFEHELMHTETFLHMLVQSRKIVIPVQKPDFTAIPNPLKDPRWLPITGGEVMVGVNNGEELDYVRDDVPTVFGWDNESPLRTSSVRPFQIQHRPVTNLEYLCFMKSLPSFSPDLVPASFAKVDASEMYGVKTVFGILPVTQCMNWPVALNYHQATAYLHHLQVQQKDTSIHIPTEDELLCFYAQQRATEQDSNSFNIGFQNWCPLELSDDEVHIFGSLWEWTSTLLEEHPGFVQSKLYPGYTVDFFDGKHHVVKGASWATHPRLAGRLRNFYQCSYPYAFVGVRFARFSLCMSNARHDCV